jgi:hypothetical protein
MLRAAATIIGDELGVRKKLRAAGLQMCLPVARALSRNAGNVAIVSHLAEIEVRTFGVGVNSST